MTESAVIAAALEREFPDHNPLMPAPGTDLHKAAQGLLRCACPPLVWPPEVF